MKWPKGSDDETFLAENIDTLVIGQRSSWENKRGGNSRVGWGLKFQLVSQSPKSIGANRFPEERDRETGRLFVAVSGLIF